MRLICFFNHSQHSFSLLFFSIILFKGSRKIIEWAKLFEIKLTRSLEIAGSCQILSCLSISLAPSIALLWSIISLLSLTIFFLFFSIFIILLCCSSSLQLNIHELHEIVISGGSPRDFI